MFHRSNADIRTLAKESIKHSITAVADLYEISFCKVMYENILVIKKLVLVAFWQVFERVNCIFRLYFYCSTFCMFCVF